jgi:DNA replication protein DnaC
VTEARKLAVHHQAEGGAELTTTAKRFSPRRVLLSATEIDDFGLAAMSDREKQDLLEAIEERYGSGATVVTAQLPVSDWHEYLGGGRVADAILDRLVHAAHRIELRSPESMRKEYSGLNHDGQSVE